jgi:hypothetical protein
MKALFGAAAAVLMFASAATAQTGDPATPAAPPAATLPPAGPVAASRCPAAAPAPTAPNGGTVAAADWEAALVIHNAWIESVNTNLACRAAEVRDLRLQLEARVTEHNATRASAEGANAAMTAQQVIYCARPRTRCGQ